MTKFLLNTILVLAGSTLLSVGTSFVEILEKLPIASRIAEYAEHYKLPGSVNKFCRAADNKIINDQLCELKSCYDSFKPVLEEILTQSKKPHYRFKNMQPSDDPKYATVMHQTLSLLLRAGPNKLADLPVIFHFSNIDGTTCKSSKAAKLIEELANGPIIILGLRYTYPYNHMGDFFGREGSVFTKIEIKYSLHTRKDGEVFYNTVEFQNLSQNDSRILCQICTKINPLPMLSLEDERKAENLHLDNKGDQYWQTRDKIWMMRAPIGLSDEYQLLTQESFIELVNNLDNGQIKVIVVCAGFTNINRRILTYNPEI